MLNVMPIHSYLSLPSLMAILEPSYRLCFRMAKWHPRTQLSDDELLKRYQRGQPSKPIADLMKSISQ